MSEHFCIRVTGDMLPVGLFAYLREKGLLLLVKELGADGDNPHFQGIVNGNLNTVRQYFKKHVPGGNAAWSIKKCPDPGRFAQYLAKDLNTTGTVIYSDGYDMTALNVAYHEEAAQVKASNKRKRVENVLEQCWEDVQSSIGCSNDGRVLAAAILRWHLDNGRRVPNAFSMQTMAMTYVCRQNDKCEGTDKLSDVELVARLYPQINF